jgi:hypothetical protein
LILLILLCVFKMFDFIDFAQKRAVVLGSVKRGQAWTPG